MTDCPENQPPPAQGCPRCGRQAHQRPTCHTWTRLRDDGTEQWMACAGCDSATEWYCDGDDCDWYWIDGLNPRNPRSEANDIKRPEWTS